MKPTIHALLTFLATLFRSRLSMQLEIVGLRHQLTVYQRSGQRPRIHPGDRILWSDVPASMNCRSLLTC